MACLARHTHKNSKQSLRFKDRSKRPGDTSRPWLIAEPLQLQSGRGPTELLPTHASRRTDAERHLLHSRDSRAVSSHDEQTHTHSAHNTTHRHHTTPHATHQRASRTQNIQTTHATPYHNTTDTHTVRHIQSDRHIQTQIDTDKHTQSLQRHTTPTAHATHRRETQ